MKKNNLMTDCVEFNYDFPCHVRKNKNIDCTGCNIYQKRKKPVLIIKFGALGDILRTTFVLPFLKNKYKNNEIFWLVEKKNQEILQDNVFINKIFTQEINDLNLLSYYEFEAIYNFELSAFPLRLAGTLKSKTVIGASLAPGGNNLKFNNEYSEYLFKISQNDYLKKKNTMTYQYILMKICRITNKVPEMIIGDSFKKTTFSNEIKNRLNTDKTNIFGIVPGSGKRWITKRWGEEKYISFIKAMDNKENTFIIFSGDEEDSIDKLKKLKIKKTKLIFLNTSDSLRKYFSCLNLCDKIITGDTLAMHIGILFGKKVFALFGPTSYNEIEGYNHLEKIHADIDCLVCYKRKCSDMKCMKKIKPEYLVKLILSN